jgi:phosphoglycerate dehydrogenase-like enzyme
MTSKGGKPIALVASNSKLFKSFFDAERTSRLSQLTRWARSPARTITPALRRTLSRAEALITTWDSPPHFAEDLLNWAPNLRIIAHCGGAVKTRFARPLFDRLVIINSAGPMTRHVAELAVTFLLYLARDVDRYRELLRRPSNAIYQQLHLSGGGEQTIFGREVGIIGFGRIGRAIAELLAPFGVRLLVHDPYANQAIAPSFVRFAPLEEVLAASHFLILAAGLTSETRDQLNGKRLRLLPKGAAVINVARGGMVDLDALSQMVLRGRLRCALDVTDPFEPLPARHPLRRAEGAILTPHVGAISNSVRHEIASEILSEMERFFSGQPVENRVTSDMLDRMT